MFISLVVMISLWEGGAIGLLVTLAVGVLGGVLNRAIGFGIGVQFMGLYTAMLTVPVMLARWA